MADDMGERTEAPTGRRLSEARMSGQIAKSPDLTAAIELIGAAVLLMVMGTVIFRSMALVMRRTLGAQSASELLSMASVAPLLREIGLQAVLVAGPALAATFLLAVLANMLQVGFLWTTQPLTPNLARLNPVAGLGRLFNTRSVVKLAVNVVKLVVVLAVAGLILARHVGRVVAMPELSLWAGVGVLGNMVFELVAWLLLLILLIGVGDFFYQKWQHHRDLRMTKQQVKDERRSMDGDPEIKSKRLSMMRQIAMQRIRQAVPKADVVVTNPTHFAVALRYNADEMQAPRVVAKGADHMAQQIRQLAMIHGVPLVERPPLARAIYYSVEVGQDIRAEHYQAVAEILAYVYRLKPTASVAS